MSILATAKFVKKAFYKNNAPVVRLFVLHKLAGKCTKIYNAWRTIVRLIKPRVLRRFRYRCGLYDVSAVVVNKSHGVDFSVFCLLLYLRKPRSH